MFAVQLRRATTFLALIAILTIFVPSSQIRAEEKQTAADYGVTDGLMQKYNAQGIPIIDYHIHLRGGMTAEKALERQKLTGYRCAVLRNIGRGWPIENETQLREFIESTKGSGLLIGLQVNDRDWHKQMPEELLSKIDYFLGDTMIMADESGKEIRLWMTDQVKIDDPEEWMERYMKHNLRVLSEPITILANPTYLPACLADRYDELWTDARMQTIIAAAVKNNVALEINGKSGLPHDRFIRLAKEMGAKFSLGSNNFDDKPIDISRCFDVIDRFGLKKEDMYVPASDK